MKKLHTRIKRKLNITSTVNGRKALLERVGPKRFRTEARALEWMKINKVAGMSVASTEKGNKFKLVRKNA